MRNTRLLSSWLGKRIGPGLILLLVMFGFTRASEVFLPATEASQARHYHSDSEGAYCELVIEDSPHNCIHSTTTLDNDGAATLEQTSETFGAVYFYLQNCTVAPSSYYYNLRAPPSFHS